MDDVVSSARSEGMHSALAFLQSPPEDPQLRVARSRPIINALVTQLEILRDYRDNTLFALGGLIHLWKEGELWRVIEEYQDWWQFGDFCTTILKMSLQRANALARIWQKSQKIGLEPDEIEEIGWNKAQHIIRVATNRGGVEQWLASAREMTQEDFIEKVKGSASGNLPDKSRDTKRIFKFTQDEAKFVDETIEFAAKLKRRDLGTEISPSEVLVFILTNWRSGVRG